LSEILDVAIEKLVYGGDGLARADGRVVLIPFVLPGERVRARVTKTSGSFVRAEALEILTPAAARETAACPYFRRCGGCHYQHMLYSEELIAKAAILREALRRIGKIEFPGEIGVVSGEPWNYRNRIQLHIAKGRAGYFQADSRRLCPIEECPIASPALNEAIRTLHKLLPRLGPREITLELFTNEAEIQVSPPNRIFDSIGGPAPLDYAGLQVSRHSFFQVNRFLIGDLVETVLDGATGGTAFDLYAGAGLFSRALAARFGAVTAVESGASSHHDSVANAQRGGTPWEAVHSPVEPFLAECAITPDLIVADPPRAGLGPNVVRDLLRLRPPQLTLVSCDPSTLARDLAQLLAAYSIRKMTLVDLFPRTAHMETVVHLQAV